MADPRGGNRRSRAPKPKSGEYQPRNEGEGNKTFARRYNDEAAAFERLGRVAQRAREAEKALEGSEAAALRDAEAEGKRRAAEEDPEFDTVGRT